MFLRQPNLALAILLTGSAAGFSPAALADQPEAVTPVDTFLGAAPRWVGPKPDISAAPETAEAALSAEASVGLNVDVSKREQVRNFYNGVYRASVGVNSGWTGNIATCKPGTTTAEYRAATLRRVNYFRAMAGMPGNVTLLGTASSSAQRSALMMSANGNLSHYPPSSWTCYTEAGAASAGQSNIALGTSGPVSVDAYMRDDGSNNAAVGHRRWVLFPNVYRIGTGDAAPERQAGNWSANTLWVLDPTMWNRTRPATRTEFIAWPVAGFMPAPLVPQRWSFSYPGADFSAASVTMTSSKGSQALTLESLRNGYGDNTLVWRTDLPANPSGEDVAYTVTLNNVIVNGVARRFEYVTTVFDPARYGSDTVLPNISGPTQLSLGSAGSYLMKAVAKATGYQWQAIRAVNDYANKVHGAEQGLEDLEPAPAAAYDIVSADMAATGSSAYHLAQRNGVAQALTFSHRFVPSAGASLSFASRLGWATTSQAATVQVSTDEGLTWTEVYRQAGSGGSGESSFSSKTVSLAAYANRPIRLRLHYGSSGSYYPQTTKGVGWYVDDIRLQNTLRVASTTAPQDSPRSFSFTPTQTGTYFLSARAVLFKAYPLEWSNTLRVAVTAAP